MPLNKAGPALVAAAVFILLAGAFLAGRLFLSDGSGGGRGEKNLPVPVEAVAVREGPLSLQRTFSGTLDPLARLTVAPKISGRIESLHVDVSDRVARGQTVASLEADEFSQEVAEAVARQAVAEANLVEAENRLVIARRELDRTTTLHERGIASDSVLDSVQAEFLAGQAAVSVARANLEREKAALAGARIRLGYTRIEAEWEQGDDDRTVAERFADEGDTVAANTPLYSIVELDPVIAVIQVTEKDYPRIGMGQQAVLRSDAFPDREFAGTVTRIAPVFSESSRQARVELTVPNPDYRLKPGMFVRCTLELARVEQAVSVPEMAIIRRNDRTGVFLVNGEGTAVKWVEVEPGIREGDQVQLVSPELSGRVVTLGQQLIEDGSAIVIPEKEPLPSGGGAVR
jgi:RND family efflux transporter MFP subunit